LKLKCIGTELNALRKISDKTGLRARFQRFERILHTVDEECREHIEFDFLANLDAAGEDWNNQRTTVVCPLLFGFHLALVGLWAEFGVTCNEVASFSMGEASGMYHTGNMATLFDALRLVNAQGVCHDLADGMGSMLVVIGLPLSECERVCADVRCEVGAMIGVNL
jgi:acyl transferase domain-containing protein